MSTIVKWIIGIVSILLVILLIVFYINGGNWGRNTANSTMSDAQNTISSAYNTKFTQYDGRTVTGSEVTAVIETAQGQDYCVVVATSKIKASTSNKLLVFGRDLSTKPTYTGTWSASSSTVTGVTLSTAQSTSKVGDTKDASSINYINPNGKFTGKMIMDANDAIVGIYFVQSSSSIQSLG